MSFRATKAEVDAVFSAYRWGHISWNTLVEKVGVDNAKAEAEKRGVYHKPEDTADTGRKS